MRGKQLKLDSETVGATGGGRFERSESSSKTLAF